MPAVLDHDAFLSHFRPGARVYWPGCAGHSFLFEDWLLQAPQRADGVWFCGVWIPGVNAFDPTALNDSTRVATFFMTPALMDAWQRGAVDMLPLHYSQIVHYLQTPGRFNVVLLQVAPPDEDGQCSLSISADFAPSVLAGLTAGAVVLAHVNPRLPRTQGPSVPVSRIDAWVQAEAPVLCVPPAPVDGALKQLAQQVAGVIRDGDTLQFGLGRLQAAVLAQLGGHRRLRVHSGMVSDGLLELRGQGALAAPEDGVPPVCTGVALGSESLYDAVARDHWVRFAPVSHTHAQHTLASQPQMVAVNSALEIDLLGNVNADWLNGRRVSGVGGMVDFLRGAQRSEGGRAIVAVTATAGRERTSRIVPRLPAGAVGVGRGDVDLVATEHGIVSLRHLGVQARAEALIQLAAPEHRETLKQAWHTLRRET